MLRLLFLVPLLASLTKAVSPGSLTLPWGTWIPFPLKQTQDVYVYKNVRFGANPVRFGAPSYPAPIENNSTILPSIKEPACIQIDPSQYANPPGGGDGGSFLEALNQTEDCLFLDVYVPKDRDPNQLLPVIVWFFGGAYAFGSKYPYGTETPLYTGQSMLQSQLDKAIFIAGNYRLGAFGWLAGTYMEKVGLPNAGLYDQRLLLQWVQDYIGGIGGDKNNVNVWGESAGAGSILHHIVQADGGRDPLFKRAFLQSPAFEWQWDRNGTMNDYYQTFSNLSHCGYDFNINCLRSQTIENLTIGNQLLFNTIAQTGLFPLGPSVDNIWITDLPAVLFAQKKYWRGLDSIMVSHVLNEASGKFVPSWVKSDQTFKEFLSNLFPEPALANVKQEIQRQYNCTSKYNGNYYNCTRDLIRDVAFTCNTRQLFDAYSTKAYMMQYSFPYPRVNHPAVHASDLIPTFWYPGFALAPLLQKVGHLSKVDALVAAFFLKALSHNYQTYIRGYAVHGDPNQGLGGRWKIRWPLAQDGEQIQNVMEVRLDPHKDPIHPYFGLISDTINTKTTCAFWTSIAEQISGISTKLAPKNDLSEMALNFKPEDDSEFLFTVQNEL